MDDERCFICTILKYGFAVTVGFVAGIAWMMFGG
jgi:hypothetical protein